MTDSDSYKVVTTGQILEGFDPADVQKHLVSVLRLKPEQAERFFERPRVVKKDITWASADKLCGQLAKLGVAAEIQSPAPVAELTPAFQEETTAAAPSQLEIVDYESNAEPKEETIDCPNCGHTQVKSEQCESCGVWFHKFEPSAAPAAPVSAPTPQPSAITNPYVEAQAADSAVEAVVTSSPVSQAGSLSPVAIAAAAGAALLGALVWKFVAVTFAFEFGLIAWGIGAAVGFAAAATGSHGVKAGVVCGVLALGAIVLGKYWAYDAFIDQFQEAMTDVMDVAAGEEMYDYYQEELEDARVLVNSSGSDTFVRRFMVERGYTDATNANQISEAELAEFREYVEPALRELVQDAPDFEEWQANSLAAFDEISPWEMMREDFGVLDIVFALLGIGTAFRLGSQSG